MLTDDHRHFVDQKSQTDHLLRLTSVISDHIAAAVPEDGRQALEGGGAPGQAHVQARQGLQDLRHGDQPAGGFPWQQSHGAQGDRGEAEDQHCGHPDAPGEGGRHPQEEAGVHREEHRRGQGKGAAGDVKRIAGRHREAVGVHHQD
ncbi:unnamed protein product, partial [Prorocentrum cordatum]